MPAKPATRRSLVLGQCFALGVCLACTTAEIRQRHPGASDEAPLAPPSPKPQSSAAAQHFELLDAARTWQTANNEPFVSLGHLGARYTARVHVNPEASADYVALVPGAELPAGAAIVMLHHDPKLGRPGPVFAMRKLSKARWEFVVTDPLGRILERGALPLCERCHAESAADHLFGVPRPAR